MRGGADPGPGYGWWRLAGATPARSPIMAGVKQGRCVVACLGGGVVVEGVVGGDWSRAEDGPLEGGFAT